MSCQGIWILAEQSAGRVGPVSFELLSRGRELADKRSTDLTALVIGHDLRDEDLDELIARGADRVLAIEAPELEHFLVEPWAEAVEQILRVRRPEVLLAAATTTGRTLMPYVAVKVDAGLTADCTVLDIDPDTGNLLQTRPAIGGNILATIQTPNHRPQMATVRPHSTRPAPRQDGRAGEVERLRADSSALTSRMRRVGFVPEASEHKIEDAEKVVTAGRGIKKADNLPLVTGLAEVLDAAVGASRDVVDRGWLPYPQQIGLSGKTVTPKLYVAVGVSGSIQHLAGMQTAETIVAINSDPEAQIFRVADFGIVGNLLDVVGPLTETSRRRSDLASETEVDT